MCALCWRTGAMAPQVESETAVAARFDRIWRAVLARVRTNGRDRDV